MNNSLWRGKRALRRWENDRQLDGHMERLKSVRPVSCDYDWEPHALNNNKKLMQKEQKCTEIERDNRHLLEKIASTMRKKSQWQGDKQKMGRSLHSSFRKKQLETIQVENKKLLKRIQQKKSDYNSLKLKVEWKKQKQMLKNIGYYPFTVRSHKNHKKKSPSHHEISFKSRIKKLGGDIEMVRARIFNGQSFIVTLKLDDENLKIVGQRRKTKIKKIIIIPKDQAMAFIEEECSGKLENIFDRLSFDIQDDTLYLIGNGGEQSLVTIKQKKPQLEEELAQTFAACEPQIIDKQQQTL